MGRRRPAAAGRGQLGRHAGQCYIGLPFPEFSGRRVRLADRMGDAVHERDGDTLSSGLYLDMPAWGYHAFALNEAP